MNDFKESKAKVPSKVSKSPTPEDFESEEATESSPEKSMEVDEPVVIESDRPTEPSSEELKSPSESIKLPKKVSAKKTITSEPTQKKPSLTKHDVEIIDLSLKEVDNMENTREKPEEKESIFVSGIKLKKSSVVKREIEKSQLETVDLVSHADESLPVSEEVSNQSYTLSSSIPLACPSIYEHDMYL